MYSTNFDARIEYTPGDPILIKNIVSQLKSQGVFDQFRKECISDVDTKPAYQNLCHRVDGRVAAYLSDVKWGPDLNKNQLRENIRKHVNECTFVDSGICRIVDQLVNPRINTVLVPKVENIVYCYLGIERPENDRFRNNHSASEKTDVLAKKYEGYDEKSQPSISSENDRLMSSPKQQMEPSSMENIFPNFKNGIERKPTSPLTTESTSLHGINACSDIDSDEDDMSPPFEPHEKSDVEVSAESDYSMDISDTKYDVKSEPSETVKLDIDCPVFEPSTSVKPDDDCDKIFRNLERICGEESMDSATSSCTDKMNSRKPSSSFDLPNTPTINYETSDESQDNQLKKNLRRDSVQNDICVPDTSSMDSFAEKSQESDRVSPTISVDDVLCVGKSKNEDIKGEEDSDLSKGRRSETKSSDSKDSKRDHKYSSSKKDKNYKSDKDRKSSRDKDKDRSNHESKSQALKTESNRSRKEYSKDEDKSKHSERSTKENDSKHRDSSRASSSSDKNRSSTNSKSKTDDSKDDRKKKSTSSKVDSEKDRERSKHRKEESSELKKSNKTPCNSDKKMRNDRRSSDRDSSGPSSSANSSSQRSSSKTDKEKYRHSSSSSSSSSHKTKKNVGTKDSDRATDALFDTMLSVTGSATVSNNTVINTKGANIENTSSLLDILNDNSDCNTSRATATCKENKSSSMVGSRGGKSEGESTRNKENKKKSEQEKSSKSNNSSGSSRKNSVVSSGTLKVDASESEVKKPKIARNAADILRIMELRKQYSQKLETVPSSVQSEPENKKGDSNEEDSRKSFSNQESLDDPRAFDKIDQNVGINTIVDSFGDCKLKLKKIDSRYRLVNGSYSLNRPQNHQLAISDNDVNVSDGNTNSKIEDSNDETLILNAQMQSRSRKLNGSLEDSPDLEMNISGTQSIHLVKNRGCETTEAISSVVKSCIPEENEEVLYFEPPKLDTDFINFVAKRVQECEEMCLENFSIHLKCPERYDHIFRNQLGATVKRKCGKSDLKSSPFKYNSEIIDNRIGNEKGIMMRIKKTVSEKELLASSCGMNHSNGLSEEAVCNESRNTFSTDISATSNKTVSAKRKTLGIKRRLSNHGKVTGTKVVKRKYNVKMNGALNSEKRSETILDSEIVDDVGSCESIDGTQSSHSSTQDSQRSFGSNPDSVHSAGLPTPKIPKVMSKEQKRKQFYYDANDLYKPRPSFLFSSRRSRGLDPTKE